MSWLLFFEDTVLQVGFQANHVSVWCGTDPPMGPKFRCRNPVIRPATREIRTPILISIARPGSPFLPPFAGEGCEGGIEYLVRYELRRQESLEEQALGHGVDHADKDVGRHRDFAFAGDGEHPRCSSG